MKAIAVIPTVFASKYLDALIVNLRRSSVAIVVVCNLPGLPPTRVCGSTYGYTYTLMYREWGIYRTWNFGLRLGAVLDKPVLILNDDIVLSPSAVERMVDALSTGEWAILGFDYSMSRGNPGPRPAHGTIRVGGVGGFAFGCNARLCARVDRRFKWWGGDDDLFLSTEKMGGKVGILDGTDVEHPEPSLTAWAKPELLPEGWAANDHALLVEKHGRGW